MSTRWERYLHYEAKLVMAGLIPKKDKMTARSKAKKIVPSMVTIANERLRLKDGEDWVSNPQLRKRIACSKILTMTKYLKSWRAIGPAIHSGTCYVKEDQMFFVIDLTPLLDRVIDISKNGFGHYFKCELAGEYELKAAQWFTEHAGFDKETSLITLSSDDIDDMDCSHGLVISNMTAFNGRNKDNDPCASNDTYWYDFNRMRNFHWKLVPTGLLLEIETAMDILDSKPFTRYYHDLDQTKRVRGVKERIDYNAVHCDIESNKQAMLKSLGW